VAPDLAEPEYEQRPIRVSMLRVDSDNGNLEKNWDCHRVPFWEAEEVVLRAAGCLARSRAFDLRASLLRAWPSGLGAPALSFTVRRSLIRVISARDMTRRELKTYEQSKA